MYPYRKDNEGQVNLRNIDLLVLVLVEIALDELLEIAEPHLPRLTLLELHLVEAAAAQATPHVLLEPVIQKGAAA